MLTEPAPTAFDLRWRMFGVPVRVHPTFWLFSAILGWGFLEKGFGYLALWVGCMFLSILVHEMGHVLAAYLCGQRSHVVLYSFGGLAIGNFQLLGLWQRIAVSAAGPAAGLFLFLGVLLFGRFALGRIDPTFNMPYLHSGVRYLVFMNLFWSLLNLLPVFPLDGGQISRDVCLMFSRRKGFQFSLGLSFLVAGLIAAYSLMVRLRPDELPYPPFDPTFNILMFGLLAMQSFLTMQAVNNQQRRSEDEQEHW